MIIVMKQKHQEKYNMNCNDQSYSSNQKVKIIFNLYSFVPVLYSLMFVCFAYLFAFFSPIQTLKGQRDESV